MGPRFLISGATAIALMTALVSAIDIDDQGSPRCEGATLLVRVAPARVPGLKLGQILVSGFSSSKCAHITLRCGPRLGGNQTTLALELTRTPASRILLRGPSGSDGSVKFVAVGATRGVPRVPRCLRARAARKTATLAAPYVHYALFVFPPKGVLRFRLIAYQGGRRLGTAVLTVS